MKRFVKPRFPAWVLLTIPVLTGALVMMAGGAPRSRWAFHLATGLIGLLAGLALGAIPERVLRRVSPFAAALGVAIVASTLLGTGMEGVRRWHDLGVVRLHPSALFGPSILLFAVARLRAQPVLAHVTLLALQLVHVLQPDAGQATAVGAAALVAALLVVVGPARYVWALAHGAIITVAWSRPDPLAPAPFVEDIVGRALALSPVAGFFAVLSLAPMLVAPWWVQRESASLAPPKSASLASEEDASLARAPLLLPGALTAYLAASLIVPVFGEFPVPLLGFGASPVLGAFFALAALRHASRPPSPARAQGDPELVTPRSP